MFVGYQIISTATIFFMAQPIEENLKKMAVGADSVAHIIIYLVKGFILIRP